MSIPKRILGSTGQEVTILGLGGEGILRTHGYEREAYELINRALDLGINYCESARAYDGSEAYYGRALRERRRDIFLTRSDVKGSKLQIPKNKSDSFPTRLAPLKNRPVSLVIRLRII